MATLISGAHSFTSPLLNGKSVTDLRCAYRTAYNIPDTAVAYVNGKPVSSEAVALGPDDELSFNKATGQKG